MAGRVDGKVALVTGGSSGIGRACSELLAAEGALVVVSDIQVEMGKDVVAGIIAKGGKASFVEHDVTSEEAWELTVKTVQDLHGRLDVLVNNAGIGLGGAIEQFSLADWRRQQSINVEGVFLGVKYSLPLMRAGKGGSIINMSSVAGLKGAANMSAYCATKGAVRLFTKSVALECAAMNDGIRCNSVHPGIIETPIWVSIAPGISGGNAPAGGMDLDALTAVSTPLGHKGYPMDIASGVLYLASDESSYVTASELVIDGGFVAR
jgi:NAD(P)-dependent dehydrogenase (short-subunit alcohol dehydrogenase family)